MKFDLPEYPQKEDMWDKLASETRPILIYGMGNGADKLISRFEKLNIKFSDIFASDGFVRGHSFHGIRVKSFSEVRERYADFVIVLSFASNRADVIEMLSDINSKYDMYIPDMPVAGEEYFDKAFYNRHYSEIKEAYDLLEDDESQDLFASVIHYKLSGKMQYLLDNYISKKDLYSFILGQRNIENYIDCGAYNGDTLKEAMEFFPKLKNVFAIEPDIKNYKRLVKFSESVIEKDIKTINAAVWSSCFKGSFISSGNRNSSVSSTASYQHKNTDIPLISVDSLQVFDADFIKYDVEGAELEALFGSIETLEHARPVLLVSAYHRSSDVFSLLLHLREKHPSYKFYMRRLLSLPAWELDIIAVPEGKTY